jgi:hypothetical protein
VSAVQIRPPLPIFHALAALMSDIRAVHRRASPRLPTLGLCATLHHAPLGLGAGMKRYFLSVCAPRAVATVVFALLTAIGCSAALAQQMNTPHPADPGQLWLSMEYLTWSVSGDKLPALVTTSPAGTPQASAGVLGAAGTSVLFGNSTVDGDWRSGGRVSGGYWFDRGHTSGVEVSVFGLEQASTGFNANSGSFPILARPFTDATTGLQNANLIAFPGLLSGSVTASETSNLLGADAVYRRDIGDFGREHLSALFGYRFLYASDHLDISSASTVIGGQVLPLGTVITPNDDFKTQNYFSGIDFGIAGDSATGPWSLEWRADVALGVNVDREQINGSTTILTRRRRYRDLSRQIAGAVEQYRQLCADTLCRGAGFLAQSRLSVRAGLARCRGLRRAVLDRRAAGGKYDRYHRQAVPIGSGPVRLPQSHRQMQAIELFSGAHYGSARGEWRAMIARKVRYQRRAALSHRRTAQFLCRKASRLRR